MTEKVPWQLPSPHELKYCCFLLYCVLFIIVIRVNDDEINYLYQRLATAATLMCGPLSKAAEFGTAHSLHPKGEAIITKI